MALLKNIEKTIYGSRIVIDSAYIVINQLDWNKECTKILVFIFDSKDKENIIETKNYEFISALEGENFVKQAYEYLKTLEEFKDSKDC